MLPFPNYIIQPEFTKPTPKHLYDLPIIISNRMELFIELSILICITVIIAGLMRALKQPLIIGYIFAGILSGPRLFDIISSTETMSILSHIGVALLLFIVGLGMSPKIIKDVGMVSLVTGAGQVIFTTVIGFFLCILLGFSTTESLYVAVALTFSSTIIIMKILSDKGDMKSLYGRISIGFLIVQDLIAIIILMVISSNPVGSNLTKYVFGTALKGFGLIVVLFLIGVYILPGIIKSIARTQELL